MRLTSGLLVAIDTILTPFAINRPQYRLMLLIILSKKTTNPMVLKKVPYDAPNTESLS